MQKSGSDTGDLGSTAAILIGKLGTTVMGVFWQISGATEKRLSMLNYYAIYHLTTTSRALIEDMSQALAVQYHRSDAVLLALLAADDDLSSSLRSSWLSTRTL